MIKITHNNRDKIIQTYCERLLDDMDYQTLYEFALESLLDNKDEMDTTILENEINEYYPDLMEPS